MEEPTDTNSNEEHNEITCTEASTYQLSAESTAVYLKFSGYIGSILIDDKYVPSDRQGNVIVIAKTPVKSLIYATFRGKTHTVYPRPGADAIQEKECRLTHILHRCRAALRLDLSAQVRKTFASMMQREIDAANASAANMVDTLLVERLEMLVRHLSGHLSEHRPNNFEHKGRYDDEEREIIGDEPTDDFSYVNKRMARINRPRHAFNLEKYNRKVFDLVRSNRATCSDAA